MWACLENKGDPFIGICVYARTAEHMTGKSVPVLVTFDDSELVFVWESTNGFRS